MYIFFSPVLPKVPKLVVTEASKNWLKVWWNAVKSQKFFYKLVVKQGETEIFNKRVDNVPLKLEDLNEGKVYMAYLSVCTETSKCNSTSKGTELQTVVPASDSSGN